MSRKELLGVGMMALAAVLALIALWTGWSAIMRGMAISDLKAALAAMGDAVAADRSAKLIKTAAAELPGETAAVLPSLDLTDSASKDRLDHLSAICDAEQRPLIDIARAYGSVLRNESANLAGAGDDPDLALLSAIVQMRSGSAPVAAHLGDHAAPHLPVLMLYQMQTLASALAARDAGAIADAAGAEAMLEPGHAEALLANLVGLALAPKLDVNTMVHFRDVCQQKSRLPEIMLELGELVPEHRQTILAIGLSLNADVPLDVVARTLVQAANDGRVDGARAVQALLIFNQPDLALPLVAKLPQSQQEPLARALHNRIGDTAALATLGAGDPTIMPRCTEPQVHHGILCFHVTNLQGCLPRTGVSIHLNGVAIADKKVHRVGTLFGLKLEPPGPTKLEVFAGAQAIYTGMVGP